MAQIIGQADHHEIFDHIHLPDSRELDQDELFKREVEHFWPGGLQSYENLGPQPESPPRFEADDDDPFYSPIRQPEIIQPGSVEILESVDYLPSSPPESQDDQANLESSPEEELDMADFEEFLRFYPERPRPDTLLSSSPPDATMGEFMSDPGSPAGSTDDSPSRNQNLHVLWSPLRAQLPSFLPDSPKANIIMKDTVEQQNMIALNAQKPGGMPTPVPRAVSRKIHNQGSVPSESFEVAGPPGHNQSFFAHQRLGDQHMMAMHHSQKKNDNVNRTQMAAPASQSDPSPVPDFGYPPVSQPDHPAASEPEYTPIQKQPRFTKAGVNKTGRNAAEDNAVDNGSSQNAQQHTQSGPLSRQASNQEALGLKDNTTSVQQANPNPNTTANASSTPPAKSTKSSKKKAPPAAARPATAPQSSRNFFMVDSPAKTTPTKAVVPKAVPTKAAPPKDANTSIPLPVIAAIPQDLKNSAREKSKQQAIHNAQGGGKDHTLIPVVLIPPMSGVKPTLETSHTSLSGGKSPLGKSQTLSGGSFKAVIKNLKVDKNDDVEDDSDADSFGPEPRSIEKDKQQADKEDDETPAQTPKRSHKKMPPEARLAARAQRDAAKAILEIQKKKKNDKETLTSATRRTGLGNASREQESEAADSDTGKMTMSSASRKSRDGGELESVAAVDKGGNKKRKRESTGKGK